MLDKGKLTVTSQIGIRAGLGAGAYDPVARIKALDEMRIDMQAISPSPILLILLGGAGCGGALFAQAERGDSGRRAKNIRIASSVSAACRCKACSNPSPSQKRRRAWA